MGAEASGPSRVVVIGGGVSGLAAAHHLLELCEGTGAPISTTLVEGSESLGGTIATTRTEGFLIEGGPDAFLSEKPWALDLARRLGIESRVVGTIDRDRRTFVLHAGRLHPLPEGFLLMAPTRLWPLAASRLFSWRGKLRMALDLVLPRGPSGRDESLGEFVTRRLGREALERVAQPLIGGIYTADATRLSLAATMPRFLEMERQHRSLIRAMRRAAGNLARAGGDTGARWSLFLSFAEGMQELIDAIARRLPEGCVRLGTPATRVERGAHPGSWQVVLADGTTLSASAVILAAPAHRSAVLLGDLDPELARLLRTIPYASSAVVTLAYPRDAIRHPLNGFGFVVPQVEGRPLLACTFSSLKFPGRAPPGHVLLRTFMGGALDDRVLEGTDAELEALAHDELAAVLGLSAPPRLARVTRYPARMPQYHVGHLERLAAIEERLARHTGIALAGAGYRGIGIPDCIRSGEQAAEQAVGSVRARTG